MANEPVECGPVDRSDGGDGSERSDGGDGDHAWTRRGLIAGAAAAGIGAAAAVVGGADPAGATDGSALIVGQSNTAAAQTILISGSGSGVAFFAEASTTGSAALQGSDISNDGYGVYASSAGGVGVYGTVHGSSGITDATSASAAILGDSDLATGVVGASSESNGLAGYTTGQGLAGVFAYDLGTVGGQGVYAQSDNGYGLQVSGGRAPILIQGSGGSGPPGSDLHRVGELYADGQGSLYYCVGEGTPGTWVQIAVASTTYAQGAFCLLPSPVRLLDTREGATAPVHPGKPITGDTSISVPITGQSVGGISVPSGSVAVIGNVTAVNAIAHGYLTLWPDEVTQPDTSSLNFPATSSVANGVTVALSTSGKLDVYASQTTDVIFDATGFIA